MAIFLSRAASKFHQVGLPQNAHSHVAERADGRQCEGRGVEIVVETLREVLADRATTWQRTPEMLLVPMPVSDGSEYGNAAVELQVGVAGAPVVTMPIAGHRPVPNTALITFECAPKIGML